MKNRVAYSVFLLSKPHPPVEAIRDSPLHKYFTYFFLWLINLKIDVISVSFVRQKLVVVSGRVGQLVVEWACLKAHLAHLAHLQIVSLKCHRLN